jgi:hypothetical protein
MTKMLRGTVAPVALAVNVEITAFEHGWRLKAE